MTKEKAEEIFISEYNEEVKLSIIVEGDSHSIWAYLLETDNDEQNIICTGFICSQRTVVENSEAVQQYVNEQLAPPLMEEYKNEFSIRKSLKNGDLLIEWLEYDDEVVVHVKEELYLIINYIKKTSYSKAVSKNGPYGNALVDYVVEG